MVILSYLELLPMSIVAEHEEVSSFIENNRLMGKGLGYVDVHSYLRCINRVMGLDT
jgi:hypothetical protein